MTLLSTCPPVQPLGGGNRLDNTDSGSGESVLLSTCPGGIQEDRLDNWTGQSQDPLPPISVGSRIQFDGSLGRIETDQVEAIVTDMPGHPGETCYRVASRRTIPHRRVRGVEAGP